MAKRLTIEEKMSMLTLSRMGKSVRDIAKAVNRSTNTVQRILREEQSLIEDSAVEDRIREQILDSLEKTTYMTNEALFKGSEYLQERLIEITDRDLKSAADINMVINIMKQLTPIQTKALENSERVHVNKNNYKLKERELDIRNKEANNNYDLMTGLVTIVNDIPKEDD